MGFLQQFLFVIKYKNRIYNEVGDKISRPIVNSSGIFKHNCILHETYIEKYVYDNDFQDVYESLSQGNQIEELYYHAYKKKLYHLGKLCVS